MWGFGISRQFTGLKGEAAYLVPFCVDLCHFNSIAIINQLILVNVVFGGGTADSWVLSPRRPLQKVS